MELRDELLALPASLRDDLHAHGFDQELWVKLAATLEGTPEQAAARRDARNRIRGEVRAPSPEDLPKAPEPGTAEHARLSKVGEEAIARGELAFCVMAGGMATRMGGVVKALVRAIDDKTFLDLRLNENATWSARAKRPVPLWLMTSEATDAGIEEALKKANAPPHVRRFQQNVGLRLTADGHLFREANGEPSTYATGHGDLPDALRRSGLLRDFRNAGGKYVWITNLDNLGATIDPAILGHFLETKKDVMVEVCDKVENDRGGIPVWAPCDDGVVRLQVVEEFRLPTGFDPRTVRVFNTNTFLTRADPLDTVPIDWHWFEVEKKVEARVAVQFERLLQELTCAMPAGYVRVPREGETSRFLPVKDFDELARRKTEIERVARTRGMLR
jgi:UTP--glucose-1-phosphate uridylyltransferase